MAGLGIVLSAAITTSVRERPLARALAALRRSPARDALYFTFSRGALLATFVGLVAFVVTGRPTAFWAGPSQRPPTALAIGVCLGADRLSSAHPIGQLAVDKVSGWRWRWCSRACVGAAVARAFLVRVDGRTRFGVPARVGARAP